MGNIIEQGGFNPESEIEYSKISNDVYKAVENASLEDGEYVQACDLSFYVMYFDDLEDDEPQAFYSNNSSVADSDIYIYDKLPESEKKRSMFHEIYEMIISGKLSESEVGYSEDDQQQKAHEMALKHEEEQFGERPEQININ